MKQVIINTLHASEKPLDVVDLALLLKEDANDVGAALLELKRAGRVHENHRHRFRLTNEERTRLREQHGATPVAPPKVPRSDLCRMRTCSECSHYDRAGRFENGQKYCNHTRSEFAYVCHDEPACRYFDEQTSAATTATDQTVARRTGEDPAVATLTAERSGLEPATRDTEVSAAGSGIVDSCSRCAIYDWPSDDRSQQAIDDAIAAWHESTAEVGLPQWMGWSCEEYERWIKSALEPTDAELDAIEAEESESAMAEQWDVECAAKDRPTNGLRVEQVARELVEVESRRQELIEELGRLVGGS